MLAKDSVQVRLERGLSFTEFSYMLLQASDFEHLHRTMGVELQMGGADQWGNITAGLELIRRTERRPAATDGRDPAHGLAYKLLLTPSGTKFGKTEEGDVGLARRRRGPRRTRSTSTGSTRTTATSARYLRWFTEFPRDEIEALEAEQAAHPEARAAQRALASTSRRGPTARGGRRRRSPIRRRCSRREPVADPAVLASLFAIGRRVRRSTPAWLRAGVAVLLAEPASSRRAARRAG